MALIKYYNIYEVFYRGLYIKLSRKETSSEELVMGFEKYIKFLFLMFDKSIKRKEASL